MRFDPIAGLPEREMSSGSRNYERERVYRAGVNRGALERVKWVPRR